MYVKVGLLHLPGKYVLSVISVLKQPHIHSLVLLEHSLISWVLAINRSVKNAWRAVTVLYLEHQMSLVIVKVDITAQRDQKQLPHHHMFAQLVITALQGVPCLCLVLVVAIQILHVYQTVPHAQLVTTAYLLTTLEQLSVTPFLLVCSSALQAIIVHQA